jgi:hypothetical protein
MLVVISWNFKTRKSRKSVKLGSHLYRSMQKRMTRNERQVSGYIILDPKNLPITDLPSTLDADEETDPVEQEGGHRRKHRKRGSGRIHDLSGDQSDAPEVTPHTKTSEAAMTEMMLVSTEYMRSQIGSSSSSSSNDKRDENDGYTFAQRIQLEDMKNENLKLQYKVMLLEQSKKDSA